MEPRSSKIAPKIFPRQPPGPSGGGPKPQNSSKSAVALVVFTLRPFFPRSREKSHEKCSQDPPKSSQTEPNMVILALSWPILGPTCCQLDPSCVHLGPIFAKNLHQIAPGISRSAPRHPKTTQRVAKGLQDSPGAQMFMVLGSILDLIFQAFPSVSPSILHGIPASS